MRARYWLNEKGFSLREYNVNTDRDARDAWLRAAGGRNAVPVFEVGGRVIIGFSKQRILAAAR